jgi:Mg/Co/Ni transporter MgtE (contains CBS domain)
MKVAADFVIDIPTVKIDDLVTKARQKLRDDIFREVFVYDAKKVLAGYIDITDVLRVTATKSNITVEGFLKEITPVLPGVSVEEAACIIRKNRTNSAPVIDENKQIVGGYSSLTYFR